MTHPNGFALFDPEFPWVIEIGKGSKNFLRGLGDLGEFVAVFTTEAFLDAFLEEATDPTLASLAFSTPQVFADFLKTQQSNGVVNVGINPSIAHPERVKTFPIADVIAALEQKGTAESDE